jgi:hexosaminidase
MYATKPKYFEESTLTQTLTRKTEIIGIPECIASIISSFTVPDGQNPIVSIEAKTTIPQEIKDRLSNIAGVEFIDNDEGFIICATNGKVDIFADTQAGVIAGCISLLHYLDEKRNLSFSLLWDYPVSKTRGVKLFLPKREHIGFFKEFIDLMTFFRCNTLMLEIGGAMEYKKHPEINEAWERYCEEMMEYSGKSKEIQEWTYPWYKNSIHCQNGGGTYLNQDEVMDIANYCANRGIEIVPEVPSTSHCDYLLIPHPELAERKNDPYPDTFCPSNPDSYKLLFDVLDEVIAVFNPKTINIGHDEYYSIGICEQCKGLDAVDIFANDVTKIHGYLQSKGIRTMIWADKLLNITKDNGHGGAEIKMYKAWNPNLEFQGIIPATWKAIYKVPKDIICLNWCWAFGLKYDADYRDNGFEVVFGNFSGSSMRNYQQRCADNVTGGIMSNWGETSESYLKRNGIYFEMAFNNHLFWDAEFNDDMFFDYVNSSFMALYAYKYRDKPCVPSGTYIEIEHSTDKCVPRETLVDGNFLNIEKYRVGDYIITYEDSTIATLPVFLGDNIVNGSLDWSESQNKGSDHDFKRRLSVDLRDVAYTTLPSFIKGKTTCTYLAKNPYPKKKIVSIIFKLSKGADWTVSTERITIL